jgi:hypothetical protein
MESKYKNSPMLKGRLVNLIRMIIDMVFIQGFELPQLDEFLEAFKKVYTMKDYADVPLFMQVLPWDAHWHISFKIFELNILKTCPYDTPDAKWGCN